MENQLTVIFGYFILYSLIILSLKFFIDCFKRLTPGYKRKKKHVFAIWQRLMEDVNKLYDLSFQKGFNFDNRLRIRNLKENMGVLSKKGLSFSHREIDDLILETESIYLDWIGKSPKIENYILVIQRGLLQIRSYLR